MSITLTALQKQRSDTAANWTAANPTLLAGEIGLESDTGYWKVGNGSTAWTSLAYVPGLGAEIPVSRLADGSARQLLQTAANGTDVEWASNIDVPGTLDVTGAATFDAAVTIQGNLTVNGTTTNINTQNLVVEDKNVILGDVSTPSDVTADGGGITLKGTTDKTINWVDATDAWTSSEHLSLASGKAYYINGTQVLSDSALGSGVTVGANQLSGTIPSSVLGNSTTYVGTTSVALNRSSANQALTGISSVALPGATSGTITITPAATAGTTAITIPATTGTLVTTGDSGSITSTMIADGTILNADVNASAAIAGTKISPDFGSQNTTTTGTSTAASFIPSSSTAPTNGLYLNTTNSVALATNGSGRLFVNSSGQVSVGTTSAQDTLNIYPGTTGGISLLDSTNTIRAKCFIDNNAFIFGIRANNYWVDLEASGSTQNAIRFITGTGAPGTGNERVRIDSSGRLLVGLSSSIGNNDLILSATSNGNNVGTAAFRASANGAEINLYKSRSSTVGTNTVVQSGDTIGQFDFRGADGTNYITAASIIAQVDATPGTNDMPGRLIFSTTADGASSSTERARINNTGYLTGTVNGLSQGLYACEQYYRLNANLARSDVSTAQSIFGVGVTLIASTIYEFEVVFALAKTAGTNSHTIGIGFGGTATLNNILYELIGANALAYPSSAAPDVQNLVDVVTNTTMTSAITTAARNFRAIIKGTVSVNAGGTFIPQFTLSAAPVGGAYSTLGGSYIKIAPLGASGANISIGSWA